MAGSRGYRSYRGKGSKKKVILAAVLLLVILAALAVSLVQKYIVYDETGAPQLEVPWQETETQEPEEQIELDLVIQPAEPQESFRGYLFSPMPLYVENCQAVLREDSPWDAAALVLKDNSGTVYYDSAAAPYNTANVAEEAGEVIRSLTEPERALHTIAAIACFHDPKAANGNVEGMALKNTGGYIFYDGNNSQWLDPAKPAARQYLCALAAEAAVLGFREILLTDVSYPTEGKVDKIAYGEGRRQDHLQTFLKEVRGALEPHDVKLSIWIPAEVISLGTYDLAGLDLAGIAPLVDRIYAQVLPEEVEACAAAVQAVGKETDFVPILPASEAGDMEQVLIQ